MDPVNLNDLVEAIEQTVSSDTLSAWIDRRNGKICIFDTEILGMVEDTDDENIDYSNYPEWQHEEIREAINFLEQWDGKTYVALPDKYEIHEYDIMEKFGEIQSNPHKANSILSAIRGKGAFRRFRDAVDKLGITDEWYAYRDCEIQNMVRSWCKYNDIKYTEPEEV